MFNPFAPPEHRSMKELQAEGCRTRVDVHTAIVAAAGAGAAVTLATIVDRPLPPGVAPGHLALHRSGFMGVCLPLWSHPAAGWFVDGAQLSDALRLVTDERCRIDPASIRPRSE